MSVDRNLEQRVWAENPDAVIATAADGRVQFWNPASTRRFGFTLDEALGACLTDLVGSDRSDTFEPAGPSQNLVVYEDVRRRRDGTLVHVSISRCALRGPRGETEGFLYT